jgi:hypothetical protein
MHISGNGELWILGEIKARLKKGGETKEERDKRRFA